MQLIAFINREKFVAIIPATDIKLIETIKSEIENELTGECEPPKYHVSVEDNTILYVDEYGMAKSGYFDQYHADNASILIICDETKIKYCPKDEFIVLRHSHPPRILPDLIASNKYIRTFEGREDRRHYRGLKNRYPELIDYLIDPNTKNYTQFIKDTFPELNPQLEKCLNNLHNLSTAGNFGERNSMEEILEGLNDFRFKTADEIRIGLQNKNKQAITVNDDCCVIWDAKSNPELAGVSAKKIINNKSDFYNSSFSSWKQIYILAELIWDNKIRSEFHGFTFAKEIRKKGIKCPIIFCSFAKDFNYEHFPDARIRKTSGHYFVHLPDIIQPNNYNFELDKDTLDDINVHMSDLQALRDIFHNANDTIASFVSSIPDNKPDKIIAAQDFMATALKKILESVPREKHADYNATQMKILTDIESIIKQESYKDNNLRGVLDKYKAELYALLPKDELDIELSKPKRKNWEVLLIDDVKYNCTTLVENFDRNEITCRHARTAKKAYNILEEDEQGGKRIAVVIADFRLYKNGDDQDDWQEEQGYAILRKIATSGRFTSPYVYIMLTSKEGSIKHNIKKRSGFPVLWFHKNDVLGGLPHTFDLFCQRIIEVGDEMYIKKRSVPRLGGWVNEIANVITRPYTYTYFYKLHIEASDYKTSEQMVNQTVRKLLQQSELPESYSAQQSFNPLRYDSNELLNKFRNSILIYRRIYLYKRIIIDNLSYSEIYKFFRARSENSVGDDIGIANLRRLFTTNWGFSLSTDDTYHKSNEDILLMEELSFLNSFGSRIYIETDEKNDMYLFFEAIKDVQFEATLKGKIKNFHNELSDDESNILFKDVKDIINKISENYQNHQNIKKQIDQLGLATYFLEGLADILKPLFLFLRSK